MIKIIAEDTIDYTQFNLGRVVFRKNVGNLPNGVGHVLGFTSNADDEIIIIVQWANGLTSNIHPDNLSLTMG